MSGLCHTSKAWVQPREEGPYPMSKTKFPTSLVDGSSELITVDLKNKATVAFFLCAQM